MSKGGPDQDGEASTAGDGMSRGGGPDPADPNFASDQLFGGHGRFVASVLLRQKDVPRGGIKVMKGVTGSDAVGGEHRKLAIGTELHAATPGRRGGVRAGTCGRGGS